MAIPLPHEGAKAHGKLGGEEHAEDALDEEGQIQREALFTRVVSLNSE